MAGSVSVLRAEDRRDSRWIFSVSASSDAVDICVVCSSDENKTRSCNWTYPSIMRTVNSSRLNRRRTINNVYRGRAMINCAVEAEKDMSRHGRRVQQKKDTEWQIFYHDDKYLKSMLCAMAPICNADEPKVSHHSMILNRPRPHVALDKCLHRIEYQAH